jgi:hypothetical protein
MIINYLKPALALRLKKYVDDKYYLTAYMSALLMCWARGICSPVEHIRAKAEADPIISKIKFAYETQDWDLAEQVLAWYFRCTGRKRFKPLQRTDTGEVIWYDVSSEYVTKAPDWPCE